MYTNATHSVSRSSDNAHSFTQNTNEHARWQYILDSTDDKLLWKSVNWNGDINSDVSETPPDDTFKEHLESLLNPDGAETLCPTDYVSDVYIPTLDDPIDPAEIDYVINKQVKPNKGCGPDGLSPGIFKLLPIQWLISLTMLLSNVFFNGYPVSWTYARLNMLFKKGDYMNCDNYRGISIINSIAKIYDYVLYNRLSKWFIPDREQAGAQPKRGCIEHLITLRLIMTFCFKRRTKLFVAYVDFSKAYDRVPRNKLLGILKRLGCGLAMLLALVAMYQTTKSILGIAIVTSVVGVRQGSPTSCFLFILFVNELIRSFKAKCADDGFLKWLHILMLMDDTVILATSRERLIEKVNILCEFCASYGMVINESKTQFMVIHGDIQDRSPILVGDLIIKHCVKYTYLGSIFTSDGSAISSLKEHALDKMKHLNKLVIFLTKNCDMPFIAKRKVVEAAFNAAIMYGCESWLDTNVHVMNKLYMGALKCLLGVRSTTANDLCLAELGMPPLQALIRQRQHSFFSRVLTERAGMTDDPLMFSLELTRTGNKKTYQYIERLLMPMDYAGEALAVLKHRISQSDRTKYITYNKINSSFDVHPVYSRVTVITPFIPEHLRLSFTRLRLSSHRLRIETGRWARLPRDQRLCPCGAV